MCYFIVTTILLLLSIILYGSDSDNDDYNIV